VSGSPAALRDDCALAAIVVLKFRRPGGCKPSTLVIDPDDIAAKGAHAIYLGAGEAKVETVADARGDRPWSRRTERADGAEAAEAGHGSSSGHGARRP
jgi:competence protein ComEC